MSKMEIVEDLIEEGDRKSVITEKLRRREEERHYKYDKKRMENDDVVNDKEQLAYFDTEFRLLKSLILSKLSINLQSLPENASAADHLDSVAKELQKLQTLVTEAQRFLPTYDKRVANEILNSLQESLTEKRNALLPKKKFAFKARKKNTGQKAAFKEEARDEVDLRLSINHPTIECGFVDRNSEDLVLTAAEVQSKDVHLLHLKNCVVKVFGNPSTVHVGHLSRCTVMLGPVSTSVFVDDCMDTTFRVACQQLRIHSSSDCTFYVHVTSRSIIEDSKRLGFAPYDWEYEDISKHFDLAEMSREINNWMCVDDFNWLARDAPSPNWTVLEMIHH